MYFWKQIPLCGVVVFLQRGAQRTRNEGFFVVFLGEVKQNEDLWKNEKLPLE